jgi:hypothetical protein
MVNLATQETELYLLQSMQLAWCPLEISASQLDLIVLPFRLYLGRYYSNDCAWDVRMAF